MREEDRDLIIAFIVYILCVVLATYLMAVDP